MNDARLEHVLPTRPELDAAGFLPWELSLEVLRGEGRIRQFAGEIAALHERTGEDSNPLMAMSLFLRRVETVGNNRPVVLLVRSPRQLQAAIYMQEKRRWGVPLGFLRGLDWESGESSVIAPLPWKAELLCFALSEVVSRGGARLAYAAVDVGPNAPAMADSAGATARVLPAVTAVSVVRQHRILLGRSFEETLGRFGPRMRRNLRYYRRQVAEKLNAEFCPHLSAAESGAAVGQLTERGVSVQVRADDVRSMQQFLSARPGLFHMGLRAGDVWLSHLTGLRGGSVTYLFQQMNSAGFPSYSLCTAMRSYFLEHEIAIGQREINFVNGTCTYFRQCCESDRCCVVVAYRGPAASLLVRWVAPHYNPPNHPLNLCRSGKAVSLPHPSGNVAPGPAPEPAPGSAA